MLPQPSSLGETLDTEPSSTSPAPSMAGRDDAKVTQPAEIGGRDGPEPTRFGDWEKGGRCIDF